METEDGGNVNSVKEREDFVKLHEKLNSESAPMCSYDCATTRLDIDKVTRLFPRKDPKFALKVWQILNAEWVLRQEEGPLRGGMLCNSCGLGKTRGILVPTFIRILEQ